MWPADPRPRQCPPGIAARPQGLGASPGSTAIELCDPQQAAKPQPSHLQMDGLDNWGASGAATVKRRTSGVLSYASVKKKRALANRLETTACVGFWPPRCVPELLDTVDQ